MCLNLDSIWSTNSISGKMWVAEKLLNIFTLLAAAYFIVRSFIDIIHKMIWILKVLCDDEKKMSIYSCLHVHSVLAIYTMCPLR